MKEIRKNINQLIVEEDNEKIDRIVLEFDKLVEEMKKKLKEMEIAEKNLAMMMMMMRKIWKTITMI